MLISKRQKYLRLETFDHPSPIIPAGPCQELLLLLRSPSERCVCKCRRSWSKRWKSFPQCSHTWLPRTLCVRRCLERLDDSPKRFPQISHIKGFSPVCVRICMAGKRISMPCLLGNQQTY